MKKILLTGFEPFSDIPVNPSEMLVRDLQSKIILQKTIQVDLLIFPVDYKKAGVLIDAVDFSEFDFIFQFGVAATRSKVSLERVALNWIESSIPDNSGTNYSPQKIASDGREAFFSSLDLASIVGSLNPTSYNCIEVSFSAGGYLCNYVYYRTRQLTKNALFIHIPMKLIWGRAEISMGDPQTEALYRDIISDLSLKVVDIVLLSQSK
jgi:pyroglutamyl-peptidase